MNIKFYLDELLYIYKKSRSEFIFLTVIYFLTLIIFSGIIQTSFYVSKILNQSVKACYLKAFLQDNVKQNEINVITNLFSQNPLVDKVEYISKERAREEFKERFPRYAPLLEMFKESPFPQNIEIRFKENAISTRIIKSTSDFLSRFPYVANVQHNYQTPISLFNIQKNIIEFGLILFVAFMVLYIPLNLSFLRSIFEKEKKLFTLTEFFGSSRTPLAVTFVIGVAIPLVVMSLINYFIFQKISKLFDISTWPILLLTLYFLILQFLFSIDVLEQ